MMQHASVRREEEGNMRGGLISGRCRARRQHLERVEILSPKNGSSQGQNLALTVLCAPNSVDSWRSDQRHAPPDHACATERSINFRGTP